MFNHEDVTDKKNKALEAFTDAGSKLHAAKNRETSAKVDLQKTSQDFIASAKEKIEALENDIKNTQADYKAGTGEDLPAPAPATPPAPTSQTTA